MKTRYYYFFRGTLATHVDLYKGWVDAARKSGMSMEMVTVLPLSVYRSQSHLVQHYRQFPYFHIIPGIPKLSMMTTILYFFFKVLTSNRVIVHLRKQSPKPFDLLKKLVGNRIRYLIELEGDAESEMEYLIAHPYKPGFYDASIRGLKQSVVALPGQLKKADHILTVTEALRDMLDERYPDIGIAKKTSVIPTGVDLDAIYFSKEIRNETRKKLDLEDRFVMIYTGNAFYTWQNVYRTIEVFKLVKEKLEPKTFLALLIRQQDQEIVREFLKKLDVMETDYFMRQVLHEEILNYLNAADIGVLLRHDHDMNRAASPGKLGEYMAAGLPILTTAVVATEPEAIIARNYGIIVDNMDDDREILQKLPPYLKHDSKRSQDISKWAKQKLSTSVYTETYSCIINNLK